MFWGLQRGTAVGALIMVSASSITCFNYILLDSSEADSTEASTNWFGNKFGLKCLLQTCFEFTKGLRRLFHRAFAEICLKCGLLLGKSKNPVIQWQPTVGQVEFACFSKPNRKHDAKIR